MFALGTAAGDLTAERLAVGYWKSALLFAALIAIVYVAHVKFGLNAILAFWIAYIPHPPAPVPPSATFSRSHAQMAAWAGDDGHEHHLPARDPRSRGLPDRHEEGSDRAESCTACVDRDGLRRGAHPDRRQQDCGDACADPTRSPSEPRSARRFFLLVPNPDHLVFDRNSRNVHEGEQVLSLALPLLQGAADDDVEGRVAISPNAYDDIVAELDGGGYDEIILSTLRITSRTGCTSICRNALRARLSAHDRDTRSARRRPQADRLLRCRRAANPEVPATSTRVLIVDDDDGVRRMLARSLEAEGYVVSPGSRRWRSTRRGSSAPPPT